MSTTEQRLAANRANALHSTGPVTVGGKATASRNATRHGLLSAKLLLDDEDPSEFQAMAADLWRSLNPLGALEGALVERIAVTLWRQRRLVQAETANLALTRQPRKIASGASSEMGRSYGSELKVADLEPFDAERVAWTATVIAEIEALDEINLRTLEQRAPYVFEQLTSDAAEEEEEVAEYAEIHEGGLTGFVANLLQWCREQQREAEARPQILLLAAHVRAKRSVLPTDTLELLARYQTTLDNQLFKLLKALREAQDWRLKTIEPAPTASANNLEPVERAA